MSVIHGIAVCVRMAMNLQARGSNLLITITHKHSILTADGVCQKVPNLALSTFNFRLMMESLRNMNITNLLKIILLEVIA